MLPGQKQPGGAAQCCHRDIKKSGRICEKPTQTGCLLGTHQAAKTREVQGSHESQEKKEKKARKARKEKKEKKEKTGEKRTKPGGVGLPFHLAKADKKGEKKEKGEKQEEKKEKKIKKGSNGPPPSAQCVQVPETSAFQVPGPSVTISRHPVASVGECCGLCSATPLCVMFLVDKKSAPAAPQHICYLKSDTCDGNDAKEGEEGGLSEEKGSGRFEAGILLDGVDLSRAS